MAPATGATDVVEASTAEAAIAAVHDRLGPEARIVDARRVLRGGIGGFFAKEVVQLHAAAGTGEAEPPSPAPPAPAADAAAQAGAAPSGGPVSRAMPGGDRRPWDAAIRSAAGRPTTPPVTPAASSTSPVDRLLGEVDDAPATMDFATFLRLQLATEESVETDLPAAAVVAPSIPAAPSTSAAPGASVAPAAPVASVVAEPVVDRGTLFGEATAATDGGPPWSAAALVRLGLPVELVRSLDVGQAADDLAWTTALAEALRTSCRPLPAGPAVMLGPNAHLIGEVEGTPTARSETWLKALRDGRWLHLVVGGDGWRTPLADEPLAVSWAHAEDLPDALRCAVELGLVLGFGPLGGRIRRARPLDVALAVRDLVDVR